MREDKSNWDIEYVWILWEKVEEKHMISNFGSKKLNAEISWKIVYNNIVKKNALRLL